MENKTKTISAFLIIMCLTFAFPCSSQIKFDSTLSMKSYSFFVDSSIYIKRDLTIGPELMMKFKDRISKLKNINPKNDTIIMFDISPDWIIGVNMDSWTCLVSRNNKMTKSDKNEILPYFGGDNERLKKIRNWDIIHFYPCKDYVFETVFTLYRFIISNGKVTNIEKWSPFGLLPLPPVREGIIDLLEEETL